MLTRIKVWRPIEINDLELRRGVGVTEPYPRHWHEEYQLCLVQEGNGELVYRGCHYATPNASLFIVHPGEVHNNHTDCQTGCTFRSIYISPDLIGKIATELSRHKQNYPFFPNPMIFDQDIIDLFLHLHLLLENRGTRLSGESLILELLVRLITRYGEEKVTLNQPGQEHSSIRRVREYLTESYAENVSLDYLAQIAGLSPFHLCRVFCQVVGMPPHAFQTQVRIARSKSLLRQGQSISQVAQNTGFADQSHFTRHFKRLMKLTPGQYWQDSKNVQD